MPPNPGQLSNASNKLHTPTSFSEHSETTNEPCAGSITREEYVRHVHGESSSKYGKIGKSKLSVELTTTVSHKNTDQVNYSRRVVRDNDNKHSRGDTSPTRSRGNNHQHNHQVPTRQYRSVESAQKVLRRPQTGLTVDTGGTDHNFQDSSSVVHGVSDATVNEHDGENQETTSLSDCSQPLGFKLECESPLSILDIPYIGHLNADGEISTRSRAKDHHDEETRPHHVDLATPTASHKGASIIEGSSTDQKGKRKADQNDEISSLSKKQRRENGRDGETSNYPLMQKTPSGQEMLTETLEQQSNSSGVPQGEFLSKRARARSMPPKFDHGISESAKNTWTSFSKELSHEQDRKIGSSRVEKKPTNLVVTPKDITALNKPGQPARPSNVPPRGPRAANHQPSGGFENRTNDRYRLGTMHAGRFCPESYKKGVYNLNKPLAVQPIGNSNNGFRPPFTKSKF
jgi:hypothetical protein